MNPERQTAGSARRAEAGGRPALRATEIAGRMPLRAGGRGARGVLLAFAVLTAAALPAAAQTWNLNPGSGDFDTAANWTPATVPTGTAVFGVSNTASLSFSTSTNVGGWTFNAGASAYTFTNGQALVFNGAGIVINGGSAAITNDIHGLIEFSGTSTAGNATITNNSGIIFIFNSTGGNAAIVNNAAGYGLDFSASSGPAGNHQLSVGSIAGAGTVYLGADQLTVGSNNLSTNVSGVISDCGASGTACASPGPSGGSLVKVGTGTLTLSGADTYTGATTVNGGTLEVDGSIATSSLTTVNSTGILTGIGTVGATQINAGGTFAPGSGTPGSSMTVSGNLAFASGALYMVQINPATASFANVTGTASLAGSVSASFAAGSYVAKQYTILESAGLGGTTFSGLTNVNLPAGFTDTLSYNTDDVFLNLSAALGAGTPLNPNQQNVASAINNFFNNGGALPPNFVTIFGLTGPSLQNALTQLSGENATDAEKGAFQFMTQYLSLMLDPFVNGRGGSGSGGGASGFAPDQTASFPPDVALAYNAILKAPPKEKFEQRWTAWGASFGGYNKTDGDPTVGTNTVTAHDFGFAGGMDYHFSPDTLAGFSLAGGGTNWGLVQGLGGGRSDAFSGGVYAKTRSGPWYLAGALAFADHRFTTDRTALGDQLTANFNGQSYGGRIETGYRYAVQPMIGLTPYAALQAQSFHTPSYTETDVTAGGFGLTYNAMNATDTRGELGTRFDDLTVVNAMPLILRARVAWAHDWVSNPALGAVFQTLPGAGFIVNGAAAPKNSALASTGAELHMTANWSLAAKFDGEFANGSQTYAGTGTLRYTW
jgi:autotransporter-associated beta strand protein